MLGLIADRYVTERAARGEFTGRTPESVAAILRPFCAFVGDDRPADTISRADIERWLERPLTAATKRNQLSVVRSWFKWMVDRDLIPKDPTVGVGRIRQPRQVPKAVDADVVQRLLAGCPDDRARLIVSLMVQEGCRCCEVANLQVGDVDGRRQVLTLHGKGGHQRQVPLTESTRRFLAAYLDAYPAPAGPLVRSYQSGRAGLRAETISDMVRQWGVEAGVRPLRSGAARGQLFSAHKLRHTAATDMVDRGADLRTVRDILGHVSIATTQIYAGRASLPDMRKAMADRDYERPALRVVDDLPDEAS